MLMSSAREIKQLKQFLEEENDKSTVSLTEEHVPSPPEAPKCCIKQGPVKSSNETKGSC